MNYHDEFKKHIYSHQLATGVRLSLATLIPCLLFWQFGVLDKLIAFPLGTLLIASTDLPGPRHRRRNTLLITVLVATLIAFATSLVNTIPLLVYIFIIIFGFLFSMIGVYGNRAVTVGTICLVVMVFNIDTSLGANAIHVEVLIFAAGGLWYILLYMALDRLRPYQPIQQLMGENMVNLSKLLRIKTRFYFPQPAFTQLFDKMLQHQVSIKENQEYLREILFQTRKLTTESSNKSRTLMLMFLDSVDLLEQIMNSQQDYRHLHQAFANTKILRLFGTYLNWLSEEIHTIGVAVQAGTASRPLHDLDESFHRVELTFLNFREAHMTQDNVEDFIMLRQILNAIRDITERVKKLHRATRFEASASQRPITVSDSIVPPQEYNPRIFMDNLSLSSGHFRHSIRVTLALLLGYTISLISDIGHGYWILLTIVTIMKPAFSITRQRNSQRLTGTLVGGFLGFLSLYYITNNSLLFAIMLIGMVAAYSQIRHNYFVACIGITVYVLISFSFISPNNIGDVLVDRIIDTAIGSFIAWAVSFAILPLWEYNNLDNLIRNALISNREYFEIVAGVFVGEPLDLVKLKSKRKNALIELANVSDAFQRMISEPKKRQTKMEDFHQFVATSHMLTSYIASLSSYAQTVGTTFQNQAFQPRIREITRNFTDACDIINDEKIERTFVIRQPLPQNEQLLQLLSEIKKEIRETGNEGARNPTQSKQLSDLRTIDGLFELIHTITIDEVKIVDRLFKRPIYN